MTGAFVFLIWNSWKNRMLMRVRRLKQPKYLIGLIVGVLYFFYFFGYRFFIGAGRRGINGTMITPENAFWFESIGALVLCGMALLAWVLPTSRAALIFSESEIAFLFPAPVKRRTLIHYRLIKSQVIIILMILFLTLISGRFMAGKIAWIHALGWWVILSTLGLHRLGASFARTWMLDHGISNWKRRVVVLLLVAAVVTGVVIWAKQTLPKPDAIEHYFHENLQPGAPYSPSISHAEDLELYIRAVLQSGPVPYLLYPFRLVVQPYVALDWPEFLSVFWPALLLMALHYMWVVRSNVAFEEASVEASRKVAERVAAIRANRGQPYSTPKKKKKAPFKLQTGGSPMVAFLWKNLIGAGHAFSLRFWFMILWIAVVTGIVMPHSTRGFALADFVGLFAMMFLMMSFFIGPQLMRQDFRQDLPMADVLKTYPMKGWQVALGELAAPVTILTGIQWILIALAASLGVRLHQNNFPLEWRLALGGSLALLAPALNCVTLIIPNATVLMFPAWFSAGKENTQGIEVMGQRIIFAFGQFFVFLGALLPAGMAFVIFYFLSRMLVGEVLAVPIGAFWATVVLAAEAWFGLLWLGKLFEKIDLSQEQSG
jgi:ABC-2 type transport system permease protein